MNERIKEFAEECTQWVTGTLDGDYELFDKEKFALLIAKKCVEVIDAQKPVWQNTGVPAEVALDMATKNVKAYFGVEE